MFSFFFKIPKKIINRIIFYYSLGNYKISKYEDEQNTIFKLLGLNRIKGKKYLDYIINSFKFFNDKNPMSSEHEVLFASIALNKKFKPENILEIGTFDGYNALLLSKLFSSSQIDTIDLSYKHENFINFYNRKKYIKEFILKRNINLAKGKNIKFSELNSLKLLYKKKKYDLIWIDGDHSYPVACVDIVNSLSLLNQSGLICCDDVFTSVNSSESDKMYKSLASFETITELANQNIIKFKLIYKRLSPKFNCKKNDRQFIAVIQKNKKF